MTDRRRHPRLAPLLGVILAFACPTFGLSEGAAIKTPARATAGNGFGRFGYGVQAPAMRFEVDKKGFKTAHPLADRFTWESETPHFKAQATSETSQTLYLGGGGAVPQKMRVDLLGAGFQLYFTNGFQLHLQSLSAPYLSWFEGSVGAGVPTAKVQWVLLTFRDKQPPLLFGFPGEACSMQIEGVSGNWTVRSEQPYTGWVRVVTPIGLEAYPANSVSQLGALVNRIKPDADFYAQPVPRLLSTNLVEDPNGIDAEWTFDRPGAVLPAPVLLASMGGYPLRVQGEYRSLQIRDALGPLVIAKESQVKLRFPVRRIPVGRALAIGEVEWAPPATVSTIDVPSVTELALANLGSQRDATARRTAQEALDAFLQTARYEEEPNTRQSFPFAASGKGTDVAAAFALLSQCCMNADRATSEPNSLLTSLTWRRDWYTWLIWAPDTVLSRRATALSAVAAALCPEKERRLDAGMFQAGLAAQRGLHIWKQVNGVEEGPAEWIEPLEGLRNALFAMNGRKPDQEDYLRMLQSEVRVYSDLSLALIGTQNGLALRFHAADAEERTIVLASAYPVVATALENATVESLQDTLGFQVIRYKPTAPGRCQLALQIPEWADPLPKAIPLMRYTETAR